MMSERLGHAAQAIGERLGGLHQANGRAASRRRQSAARSARVRSRMASATRSLLIRGSSTTPPQRSRSVTSLSSASKPMPAAAHVVDHEEVDVLGGELGEGVRPHVVRLRRKAHDEPVLLPGGDLSQDVGVGGELEREPLVLLRLDLGRARLRHAVVRHRGGLDHDGGGSEVVERRLAHLLRRLHGDVDGARWRAERGGARDQDDLRAAAQARGGDGLAHLAGRAVREIPDGIDGLARRTRGHEDPLAAEIAHGGQQPLEMLDDRLHLRQPALAG